MTRSICFAVLVWASVPPSASGDPAGEAAIRKIVAERRRTMSWSGTAGPPERSLRSRDLL